MYRKNTTDIKDNIRGSGKPLDTGSGTQIGGKEPVGSKWQMGIAVPLKNAHFEAGKIKHYNVDSDLFSNRQVRPRDDSIGISSPESSPDQAPSLYLQYGDKVLLGPSTIEGYQGYNEVIRAMGASEEFIEGAWQNGIIYALDRSNKYPYNTGDSVTIMSSGCATAWDTFGDSTLTLGIRKGISSLNRWGKFSVMESPGGFEVVDVLSKENITFFKIRLSTNFAYDKGEAKNLIASQLGEIALGPRRNPEELGPTSQADWRIGDKYKGQFRFVESVADDNQHTVIAYNNTGGGSFNVARLYLVNNPDQKIIVSSPEVGWDGFAQAGDPIAYGVFEGKINIYGKFDPPFHPPPDFTWVISDGETELTVVHQSNTPEAQFTALQTAINASTDFKWTVPDQEYNEDYPFSIRIENKSYDSAGDFANEPVLKAPLMVGFFHPGGVDSSFAQCLSNVLNENRKIDGTSVFSKGGIKQILSSDPNDPNPQSSLLTSNTYYRMGVEWKGQMKFDGDPVNYVGSKFWASVQWSPYVGMNRLTGLSTSDLLSPINHTQSSWQLTRVHGKADHASLDFLSDEFHQNFSLNLQTQAPQVFANNNPHSLPQIKVFVDNVWLEHQGDIEGASNQGYVELNHFPERATLTVNEYYLSSKTELTLSNGQKTIIRQGSDSDKRRRIIECDFVNTKKDTWDLIQGLLKWQEKGNLLTLHPHLPDVPYCLVGKLEITNVQKNMWDLEMFSFRYKFTEL